MADANVDQIPTPVVANDNNNTKYDHYREELMTILAADFNKFMSKWESFQPDETFMRMGKNILEEIFPDGKIPDSKCRLKSSFSTE